MIKLLTGEKFAGKVFSKRELKDSDAREKIFK
jgi:hypothetical protein